MMLKSFVRGSAALLFLFLTSATVGAQTTSGQTGGNALGTGTDSLAPGESMTSLDPDSTFTGIERDTSIGSTAATGQGFSDVSAATGRSGTGGARAGGLGGLGGFGGGLGGLGRLGNLFGNLNTQSTSSKPVIRTRLRSAINIPAMPPAQVQQTATRRFESLTSRPQLQGIQVTMEGRTAIIRGEVRSVSDRRMSELLMRLEPGVSRVDNQVVVASE